jgi:hypothetical protein
MLEADSNYRRTCQHLPVREFASINERFTRADSRLEAIEGKIEAFGRRVDDEVESRYALGERVSKLENAL